MTFTTISKTTLYDFKSFKLFVITVLNLSKLVCNPNGKYRTLILASTIIFHLQFPLKLYLILVRKHRRIK